MLNAKKMEDYRFGFNGMEKDNETERSGVLEGNSIKIKYTEKIEGKGNHTTALFWEYDTRHGHRWNLDPVDQISISNYAVNGDNPIWYNDPLGDDVRVKKVPNQNGKDVVFKITIQNIDGNSPRQNAEESEYNPDKFSGEDITHHNGVTEMPKYFSDGVKVKEGVIVFEYWDFESSKLQRVKLNDENSASQYLNSKFRIGIDGEYTFKVDDVLPQFTSGKSVVQHELRNSLGSIMYWLNTLYSSTKNEGKKDTKGHGSYEKHGEIAKEFENGN